MDLWPHICTSIHQCTPYAVQGSVPSYTHSYEQAAAATVSSTCRNAPWWEAQNKDVKNYQTLKKKEGRHDNSKEPFSSNSCNQENKTSVGMVEGYGRPREKVVVGLDLFQVQHIQASRFSSLCGILLELASINNVILFPQNNFPHHVANLSTAAGL